MKYKTEKEILDVIEKFASGTINRKNWGHPEHLILAYHFSLNNEFETALNKMRAGICLLYTSPSPRDKRQSRMPSSA